MISKPRLIGPPPRQTTADRTRWRERALPDDLLKEASRRLGAMSLLAAVLWIAATLLYHFVDRVVNKGDRHWLYWQSSDWIVTMAIAASLGLFAYTRRRHSDPRRILDLGLIYMVVMAFAAAVTWHWDDAPEGHVVRPVITWVGVILVMFAATTPNSPGKTFVAGLIAASMSPVGMLIARARGVWDFGPLSNVLVMHYPDYMLVGVAAVIAHIVTRLGQQVARAREMGSYELGELIGRGGMGEVYRAKHRMLARPAAIKLIRPEAMGARSGEGADVAARRFHREAEAAASLRSPHTVELYDFGETENGTLYFAMELLDGMDLESLVRQTGPMPAARVIHILRQVCESLEEAHVRGLVHRDIKPANIHVGRLGLHQDFVKVLDFGLVTSASGPDSRQSMATAAGVIPGTPAYMAPEMALGEAIDGRADIYAVGCVAYFLLTGQLVFDVGTPMQMLVRRLHEDPAPPSTRTELSISPELDRLVLACIARQPNDRPQTAALLRRALAPLDVTPWTEEQARDWWAVHRPGQAESASLTETRSNHDVAFDAATGR